MKKVSQFIGLFVITMMLFSCQNNQVDNTSNVDETGNRKATIQEVIQTTSYSYLKVDEDGNELWIAVVKQDYKVEEVVYFLMGMRMEDFKSEELDRTFETIYFVQDISYEPIVDAQQMVMGHTEPKKPHLKKIDLEIELPEGAVSIGQLYSEREKYSGKSITVKGKVTKVNTGIMGRNWIHIQDGTGDETNFDLTITSDDVPELDEIVTYWGVVAVDKDFGAGYTYEIIVEEATRLTN